MSCTAAHRRRDRGLALVYGAACHLLFVLGTGAMVGNLFFGMQRGLGPTGPAALPWNLALIAQFVVLHSLLLSRAGRGALRWLVPARLGGRLDTTVFATAASLQTGLLFGLWSPLSSWVWTVPGRGWWLALGAFGLGAGLLLVALWEAGLGVQLGYTGWTALWRGDRPRYPRSFPRTGLHGLVRHPIYLGFVAVLWLGPVWSLDKLLLGVPLTAYCLRGPRRKEQRLLARHGAEYARHLERTAGRWPGRVWRSGGWRTGR